MVSILGLWQEKYPFENNVRGRVTPDASSEYAVFLTGHVVPRFFLMWEH